MTDVDEPTYYEFITKSTESLATYISNLDPERQSFDSFCIFIEIFAPETNFDRKKQQFTKLYQFNTWVNVQFRDSKLAFQIEWHNQPDTFGYWDIRPEKSDRTNDE